MSLKLIGRCLLVLGVVTLGACGNSDSGTGQDSIVGSEQSNTPAVGEANQASQEVAFDLAFSAVLSQQIESVNGVLDDFSGVNLLNGSMQVENFDAGTSEAFSWTVNLDEDDLSNVQSLKTLQLAPGNYAFYLLLDSDNSQYVGETIYTVTDGEAALIPMTIRPVIGDQIADVTILNTLIDFEFSYSQSELASAGLSDPSIGITVDGGTEMIFDIDPTTGLSESMNLNLSPGVYDFSLRLFDTGAQVGKSADGAGTGLTVAPGFDVSIDIVPLFGEVGVALTVEGGDAVFDVLVPDEVVEEAGGLSGLEAVMSVVGTNNPLQEVTLNLAPHEAGYTDIVGLSDMYFGDVNVELSFTDLSTSDSLGSCVDTITLSDTQSFFECKLTLNRRSLVGGNILSTLGVTVIDENGAPVSGATISVDGVDTAITDSGAFSAPGYSKLTLVPGDHTIEASFGDSIGDTSYTAVALDVDNLDLVLDRSVLLSDSFDGNQTGSAAPATYWYGGISPDGCSGYTQAGTMFLGSIFGDPSSDWCERTVAVTSASFADMSVTDSGGFSVSVDLESASESDSEIIIGVGGELGSDPNNYDPTLSADAAVSVRDNTVEIAVSDGSGFQTTTHTIPYLISEVTNVTVSVSTADFQAGTSGSISVLINEDVSLAIPADSFVWDGGANHIQVIGAAGEPVAGTGTGHIEIGSLLIETL